MVRLGSLISRSSKASSQTTVVAAGEEGESSASAPKRNQLGTKESIKSSHSAQSGGSDAASGTGESEEDPSRSGTNSAATTPMGGQRSMRGTFSSKLSAARSTKSGGSKGRRSRASSGSRMGGGGRRTRTGSSSKSWGDRDDDSSGSDEWAPLDFRGAPHLQQAMPLYSQPEVMVVKKKAMGHMVDELPVKPKVSLPESFTRSSELALQLTKNLHQAPKWKPERAPNLQVIYQKLFIRIGSCLTLLWALVAATFLGLNVLRFYSPIFDDMHRAVAVGALQRLEVNATAALAPALAAARAVAMGARSGTFNTPDAPASIQLSVVPEMRLSPFIRHVQVVGASDRLVLIRPGNLHNTSVLPWKRLPLTYALPAPPCRDPIGCLGLNITGLELVHVRSDGSALGWLGPEFLRVGLKGESLPPQDWVLAHHLLAYINVSSTMPGAAPVAVDVALQLDALSDAAFFAQPPKGAIFVFTNAGYLLAGCSAGKRWTPTATADSDGRVVYPVLSSLGLPWMKDIAGAELTSPELSELWVGDDLVMIQPLTANGIEGGTVISARTTLHAVVYAPRDAAVRPILGQFAMAALGVIGAPVVALVLTVLMLCLRQAFMRCCVRRRPKYR
mmetsp:Transcript_18027/g.38481  ORF Transcript_18027/g.38481 Transcript_18027/m.38481 type:complete len:617 (+) Transcript_18027:125-1975(+)